MIKGIVDTNVLIEVARRKATAIAWLTEQVDLAITTINWLEFMQGASGKAGQASAMAIMMPFQLLTLTDSDQRWSMQQMTRYRLSHGIELNDTLIASVAYRLQVPIYTQNVKDFVPILGEALLIKPYSRGPRKDLPLSEMILQLLRVIAHRRHEAAQALIRIFTMRGAGVTMPRSFKTERDTTR